MTKNKKLAKFFWVLSCLIVSLPASAYAQSASSNYRVEESFFGTGGEVNATSPNYQARESAGSLGVGDSASANYRASSGFNTPSEPFLEAAITGADVDFGALSPNSTSYATSQGGSCNCTFYVRTYLSSEYAVITASQPPTNESGNVFTAKSVQAAPNSGPGVEEFGMNLVANTVPGTFGANPSNDPDSSFADGAASPGYETSNQFKYVPNSVIAHSPATPGNAAIGRTNYTISYIMKVSNITPAGVYKMNHVLIAVPTF